jgi:hypothetical protein
MFRGQMEELLSQKELSRGGETCLKHLSQKHPGVGTAFLFA